MPAPRFWAYVKMLPILQARDSIHRINELALAFGSMDKERAKEYTSNLGRAAHFADAEGGEGSGSRRTAYRPTSPVEMAGLGGVGTSVIMTKGPSADEMAKIVEAAAAAKKAQR